jgi:hypothetical protein
VRDRGSRARCGRGTICGGADHTQCMAIARLPLAQLRSGESSKEEHPQIRRPGRGTRQRPPPLPVNPSLIEH